MADGPDEHIRRELEFYRRQCNDLGARLLRLQEDQSRAHREARRSWTTAKLIREAYGLIDSDASVETVGRRMLEIVIDNVVCDRAAILRQDPDRGEFSVTCALGFGQEEPPTRVTLAAPPAFYFTTSQAVENGFATELRAVLGLPYTLWAFDPMSGFALILGNRSEVNVSRPFEPADRQIAEGALNVFIDIFQRGRTEADLRLAKIAAEDASRAKSSFLANLSHELRTPLNAILGFSEILKDEVYGSVGNTKYKDYAAGIYESGSHLLSLINDILDFSRLEAGKATLVEEMVDLREAAETALVTVTSAAETAEVTINVNIGNDVPQIYADARRVRQILINLLSNSVKFTPPGGQVTADISAEPDGGVLIRVSDTGIGIAEKDIPKVLELFGQVENIYNRQHPGSGLGLPLCKALTERHGGTFDLASTVGQGTVVSIRFPKHRSVVPDRSSSTG